MKELAAVALAAAFLVVPRLPAAEPLALQWRCGPNARIEGNRLIADVPVGAETTGGLASAEIDLSAWDGKPVGAEIVASGERIAKPLHWYNGLKFQFEYEDIASGELCYPNTPSRLGDFPTQTIHLRDFSPATRRKARLVLGLQETSGHVAFDLRSLRIVAPEPLWPVTNKTHRCEYSGAMKGLPCSNEEASHGDAMKGPLRGNDNSSLSQSDPFIAAQAAPSLAAKPPSSFTPRRGVMSPHRMTEDDFETLQAWGATLIRYQMWGYRQKKDAPADLDAYWRWLEGKLDHFDSFVLPQAVARGMKVVLDLHDAPGGRDVSNDTRMCHDGACADFFVETWRRIATRFKGRAGIYGYDLVNEPMQTREALPDCDYWSLQRRAAETIRAIDPNVPILVECNGQDSPSAFASLYPLDLTNVIYEVHMYVPLRYTHQ